MAVDALTAAELAALGIAPGSVPGVGPNAFVGMTPNELKEALDRRGIGYDRSLLGSMQQEYSSLFGQGSKGKKSAKADEEEEDIVGKTGVTPANATTTAPPSKDYWGYSAPVSTTKKAGEEEPKISGTSLFDLMTRNGMIAPKAPPSLPSLPGLPASKTGDYAIDLSGFNNLDPLYGAKTPSEALAGNRGGQNEFDTLDPEFGAKSPSEALAAGRSYNGFTSQANNDLALYGKSNEAVVTFVDPKTGQVSQQRDKQGATGEMGGPTSGGVGTGGSTGSQAGNTGATSPDQDNTGGIGAGSTAGGMAATGQAPGVGSGQNETSAGPGGGGGGGGGGAGGVGGMGMGDHGVGGSQGSENGQGGYRMGTADTGNDGDMMMDEEVDPPVHEDEAVIPRPMRNDIGEDILAEAIGLYQDKGLTPRERKIALKDLLGEWAAQK